MIKMSFWKLGVLCVFSLVSRHYLQYCHLNGRKIEALISRNGSHGVVYFELGSWGYSSQALMFDKLAGSKLAQPTQMVD